MKAIINAILFQGVWLACVLGGSTVALLITPLYLFLHDHYFMNKRCEWRLVLLFFFLGVLVDGSFFQFGIFSYSADAQYFGNFPPIWLLCLWGAVATLFAHSLAFLRSRYYLSAMLGFIGPTVSYIAGAKLAGITLAEPSFFSAFAVALVWSLILPAGVYYCEKWALYTKEDKPL
ncbi:DUF2878 domain-containing protein [Marinomonas pollencensis]|uniref:Uncharacterized protein DUF2878 n=1 Tax=Marinomonas pollencensis TaxID=491954 RepID=A0A3E0DJY2_9GAMM|nr:DUF2878 domain-containing protein [Marinomonas pollencensis]REG82400.1 uncharacterized protein DUF2878 [Marinomonas pollencensis]